MTVLSAPDVRALRPWFTPERPGPMIWAHVAATGHGRCRVDRWPDPHVVLADTAGNVALRGDPGCLGDAFPDLAGLVEAPPEWAPALRELDPGLGWWDRVIAVLPDPAEVPGSAPAPHGVRVRRPLASDVGALAALHPEIAWIHETWGGAAGLVAAGVAWVAFADGWPVSVAVPFYVGEAHEDIGVVTDAAFRGRGLSTACATRVAADVRARGRRPTWSTSPDNAGSLAVAAHLGFVHVRDDVLYAIRTPLPES